MVVAMLGLIFGPCVGRSARRCPSALRRGAPSRRRRSVRRGDPPVSRRLGCVPPPDDPVQHRARLRGQRGPENGLIYFRQFREQDPVHASFIDPIIADLEQRVGASSAPVSSGGGGGSANVVTTSEEAARFDAIVSELRALTDALDARSRVSSLALRSAAPAPAPLEPLPAGDPGDPAFLEDAYRRVVVTASRVGQEPLDSPSTVTIITAEDIRLSGALDIPDLLRRVAGVEVMAPSAGHSDVAIRGLQRKVNNTVLFLVDGRSLYQDSTGWMMSGPVTIPAREIERIEVIRGPGSAVYGADAVTGVVNIITRAPGEGQSELVATGGTLGVRRFSAVATGRVGLTPTACRPATNGGVLVERPSGSSPGGSSPLLTLGIGRRPRTPGGPDQRPRGPSARRVGGVQRLRRPVPEQRRVHLAREPQEPDLGPHQHLRARRPVRR